MIEKNSLPKQCLMEARQSCFAGDQIVHIVPGIQEQASGPSYSVLRLCKALESVGERVALAAINWKAVDEPLPDFVKLFRLGIGPRRLGRSRSLARWLHLQAHAGNVPIFHSHGMWQMSAVYPSWAVRGTRTRLITSPRGAFSTWAMRSGSLAKHVFWPLLQRPALSRTACFHATSEAEYRDIRRLGFRQPVAVIPNGVDVPELAVKPIDGNKTLLFLGRIHPVKGVDTLLRAWSRLLVMFPDWRLVVAGTDDGYGIRTGHLNEMATLAANLRLARVEFKGAVYGHEKLETYRSAHLFVLPSHSENFAMAVAEALAAGTAVVTTKATPWAGLMERGCGWWIDDNLEALTSCLQMAMAKPSQRLVQMGIAGRNWMLEGYSWDVIAEQMVHTYRWTERRAPTPAWLRLN